MEDSLDYQNLVEEHPWLIERDHQCILSPDSDGFLCGLLFSHVLGWKIRGFYDGKVLIVQRDVDPKECVFLDLDIFRNAIKSIGHHMVLFNKNHLPPNWNNYDECIQLNNLLGFDFNSDFRRKYPLGTIHFLICLLDDQHMLNSLSSNSVWPLLFADGVWNNLFGYTENCLDWLSYMKILNQHSLLYPLVGTETPLGIMNGINTFLRTRDSFNAVGFFNGTTFINRRTSRTGDKLRISDGAGSPINLVANAGSVNVHNLERDRVVDFISFLATQTGWDYLPTNWVWSNLKLLRFTKDNQQSLNVNNFGNLLAHDPLSLAITGGVRGVEYTLETPSRL